MIVTYGGSGDITYKIKDQGICSCKWEDGWDGDNAVLTITGISPGKTTVTITNSKDNRKLRINVDVSLKLTKYGSVSGNISYYYNNFFGNRPDTGAYILLIPKNGAGNKLSSLSIYGYNNEQLKNAFVYIAKVDGVGNYKINHVAAGDYRVLLISRKTTTGAWFAAYDDSLSDASDSYYDAISDYFAPGYLKTGVAKKLVREIGSKKYYITDITIYNGEDTLLSHDFGITYI